ncbi:CehA/McbA family metallohydrolase [Myxococcota bacterium]|nr:CehA/McbA family metallohydrolase [Myxococcota bacterium]
MRHDPARRALYLAAAIIFVTGCGDAGGTGGGGGNGGRATDAATEHGGQDAKSDGWDAVPVDAASRSDAARLTDALYAFDAAADATWPPDAAPPLRAAEQPTPGSADVGGAADLTEPVAAGRARAGRVDADAERLAGPEANCRVGDYRLDNARISLCIQDEDTYGHFSFFGGTIIDAHRAEAPGTDALQEVVVSPEVGGASAEHVGIVRDGSDGGPAILRVEGRAWPSRLVQGLLPGRFVAPDLRIVTEYRLPPDSDAVEILTWVEGDRTAGRAIMADVVLFGDRTRPFWPGQGADGLAPNPVAYLAAEGPAVSYAYVSDAPVSYLSIPTSETPVTAITYGSAFLRVGDQRLIRRRFIVGAGDVESIRPDRGEAGLRDVVLAAPAGTRLDLVDASGRAATRVRVGATGEAVVRLPLGPHRASTAPEFFDARTEGFTFEVTADDPLRVEVPVVIAGTLAVRVREAGGTPLAARLRLQSTAGESLIRFVVDEASVPLPPGEWRIETTRGWHYTVDERTITIAAGEPTSTEIVLTEVLPFEGWTSGEFHQHASPSADSDVDPVARVLSNLTEGVGFMAPSEHDIVWDFAALVSRLGLSDRIMVFTGSEISPLYAHIGAYPLPYRPNDSAGGGVVLPVQEADGRWRWRRAPELVAEARRLGAEVMQINHPRSSSSGYFNHLGYVPGEPLEGLSPDDFTRDFDTIEVFNEADDFCRIMTDWLSLLNQGLHLTAVGNSDTHSIGQPPGYPRNYLPTLADRPEGVQPAEIVDALRDGTVFVGGGAVMDFPDGRQPGQTIPREADGQVALRVRLRTPPWASLNRLLVLVNGAVALDRPLAEPASALVDFDGELRVPVDSDAHVVVLAVGPPLGHTWGGKPTFALANPLWVDVDGGGQAPHGNVAAELPVFDFCR